MPTFYDRPGKLPEAQGMPLDLPGRLSGSLCALSVFLETVCAFPVFTLSPPWELHVSRVDSSQFVDRALINLEETIHESTRIYTKRFRGNAENAKSTRKQKITKLTFMIHPTSRVANYQYAIRNIVAAAEVLEQRGRRVTYLNIGDPQVFGFRPPAHVIEPVQKALRDRFTGYAHSRGLIE